jgi:hypothetical protein
VSAAGAVVLYEAARQRRATANSPAALVQDAAPLSGAQRSGSGAKANTRKGLGS